MNAVRLLTVFLPVALLAACGSPGEMPVTDTKPLFPQITQAPAATSPGWATQLETGGFRCANGNTVELRMDGRSTDGVTLIWRGSLYLMTPVATTTGAVRLENRSAGLVWIQIPSKSMLLNDKVGQPLANDCEVNR